MNFNVKIIRRSSYLLIVGLLLVLSSGVIAAESSEKVEKQEVKLYFSDQQAQKLVPVVEEVAKEDLWQNVLEKLIAGPTTEDAVMTVPEETEVISVQEETIAKDPQRKMLIVNFSQELKEKHWGGSSGTIITINSIVNTLTQFEEVKEVKLLVEGETLDYFGGLKVDNPSSFNSEIIVNDSE